MYISSRKLDEANQTIFPPLLASTESAVGANADAGLVITEATKMQDVAAYLTANCPGLCPALRWLLSLGAA